MEKNNILWRLDNEQIDALNDSKALIICGDSLPAIEKTLKNKKIRPWVMGEDVIIEHDDSEDWVHIVGIADSTAELNCHYPYLYILTPEEAKGFNEPIKEDAKDKAAAYISWLEPDEIDDMLHKAGKDEAFIDYLMRQFIAEASVKDKLQYANTLLERVRMELFS